jgi:translation initiation factor IF-2
LEKILLESDLLELKANPERPAVGTVIEASLDKGRGYVTTVLISNGTLKVGDMLVAGNNYGKVKAMFNGEGARVKASGPSTAVQILGLNGAPTAGDKIKVYEDESDAKAVTTKRQQIIREQGLRTKKHITLDEIGRRLALGTFKEINIIIRGDVDGSVEALKDSLLKLSTEEIQVNVIFSGVGAITETDIMLASASDAIIIGFQVRPSLSARKLVERENIDLRLYSVIYDAIDEVKTAMEGMLEPKIEETITGMAEVGEVFKITKVGTVAGCTVVEGKVYRTSKIRIIRDGIVVYSGVLSSLKRFKDDAKEVYSGQECGISIKNYSDVHKGDFIEAYTETEVKRKL